MLHLILDFREAWLTHVTIGDNIPIVFGAVCIDLPVSVISWVVLELNRIPGFTENMELLLTC